jgi:dimethylargininase
MFTHAVVRPPSSNFADGLTRVDLGAPSVSLALQQHAAYCDALRACGLDLSVLPAEPAFPDACFVEDTAVLLPGTAMFSRPSAVSRAGEVASIRAALAGRFSSVADIVAPGTLDGGDICEAGDTVFIGISARTNAEGAAQLARWVESRGLTPRCVDIRAMSSILHLKSGVSWVGDSTLLLVDELHDRPEFARFRKLRVPPSEAYAANAVRVNAKVLIVDAHPRTDDLLRAHGYATLPLEMSEFEKMDGGLSCLSLRY